MSSLQYMTLGIDKRSGPFFAHQCQFDVTVLLILKAALINQQGEAKGGSER